ncbi:hypothetical protein H2204_005982 [Knufia peltigerae]|uniref:Uncharacterized protein n=1 Tax=Knufia peltigerae TaxID=1002370 RepID=A0AA38Y5T5_9EURO|nr:hypothetical protein H2204_005982 [Knufia peltigerae]
MPAEIADSDAESDFNSPFKKTVAMEAVAGFDGVAHPSQVSLSHYDFDQFLEPTQRLSSLSPGHGHGAPTASELLAGLPSESSPMRAGREPDSSLVQGKKRAYSDIRGHTEAVFHEPSLKSSSSKRTKTYAHTSKSRGILQDIDLFAPQADQNSGEIHPSDSDRVTSALNVDLSIPTAPPNGTIRLLGESLTGSTHRLSTSVASMGQYESINLDFRGSGQGINVTTNPFGSLSQISSRELQLPDDTDSPDGSFRGAEHHSQLNQHDLEIPTNVDERNSLHQLASIKPHRITQSDGPMADVVEEVLQTEERSTEAAATMAHSEIHASVVEKPPPKKRGRKPKHTTPFPAIEDDVDELSMHELPPVNRSRQGTVDSVYSQASQASTGKTSTRKRTRRVSKQVGDVTKQPKLSSEPSPAKELSSELILGDEVLIGLPKEQYKPRPSRSRSKKVADADDADVQSLEQQTSAKSKMADFEDPKEHEPPVTSTKTSTKKGRKSKVKRAKTSAAALLKRGEPMLSEGEDDVVWMDTKPAPVKLDLPPDLKVLKKEGDDSGEDADTVKVSHKEGPQEDVKGGKVSVEIPVDAPAETPVAVVVPKKRGRKPKKTTAVSEISVVEEQDEQFDKPRPALAEKSSNVPGNPQQKAMDDDDPKAPTVSPLSSPEPEVAPPKHSEQTPKKAAPVLVSPSKDTPEKPLATHSPIKPTLLSDGKKTIYRIGLSRRQNIPSLLRKVQRDKPPPKIVVRKEKENKKKKNDCSDDEGAGDRDEMRGADGMLVEWDF